MEDPSGEKLLKEFVENEAKRFLLEDLDNDADRHSFQLKWQHLRNRVMAAEKKYDKLLILEREFVHTTDQFPIASLESRVPKEMLFITSREVDDSDEGFGVRRGESLTYGKCNVTTSNILGKLKLKCSVVAAESSSTPNVFKNCKKLIIIIPGYNQSFNQAIECACKVQYNLHGQAGFRSEDYTFAAFSWPARGDYKYWHLTPLGDIGSLFHYMVDAAACEGSEGYIPTIISALKSMFVSAGSREIHFIAHSMGCRILLRALTDIDSLEERALIKSVTFASPDVDRQMFTKLLEAIRPNYACNFLLFLNSKDLAVCTAAVLHQAPRAGFVLPIFPDADYKFVGHCFTVNTSKFSLRFDGPFWEDSVYILTNHFDFLYVPRCTELLVNVMLMNQANFLVYLGNTTKFSRVMLPGYNVYKLKSFL